MKLALLLLVALATIIVEARHHKRPGMPPSMDKEKKPACNSLCSRLIDEKRRNDNDDDDDDDDKDGESRHGHYGKHAWKIWKLKKEYLKNKWRKPYPEGSGSHHSSGSGSMNPPAGRPEEHEKPNYHGSGQEYKKKDLEQVPMKNLECRKGMIHDKMGCPICKCSQENLCKRVDCKRGHACHIFQEGMKLKPYCVPKRLIGDEDLEDRHRGCWSFIKHHKVGAIILTVVILALISIALSVITCYCCKRRGARRARCRPEQTVNEKPAIETKDGIPPPYYVSPNQDEEKVAPTDFVEVPPATPPPKYTSTTSLRTISEEEENKGAMPATSC